MWGLPYSSDPEKMVKGAVGRGHPEWVEPCDMDPDERGLEGGEAKGRGLDIKQCQTL